MSDSEPKAPSISSSEWFNKLPIGKVMEFLFRGERIIVHRIDKDEAVIQQGGMTLKIKEHAKEPFTTHGPNGDRSHAGEVWLTLSIEGIIHSLGAKGEKAEDLVSGIAAAYESDINKREVPSILRTEVDKLLSFTQNAIGNVRNH